MATISNVIINSINVKPDENFRCLFIARPDSLMPAPARPNRTGIDYFATALGKTPAALGKTRNRLGICASF